MSDVRVTSCSADFDQKIRVHRNRRHGCSFKAVVFRSFDAITYPFSTLRRGHYLTVKNAQILCYTIMGRHAKLCRRCAPPFLTLARKRCFATFAGVGGGGGWCDPPPWRFQTKRRRASRKRPADCFRRVLAIGGIIFGPRSIFDPVMAGQRSNFRKFHDFSTSRVDGIKTIYRSGMKSSPACSPFNSA